ncbi:hypothetical protein LWI29_018403 [Acer saccharum]|uniref:Uncharacterized protein n=1 Tax=Acer saccharum TaxID=4024 RepID=A0AA39VW50_ACESA|nr:hypothetical protein LWI29_018403 [Acer saccharum]
MFGRAGRHQRRASQSMFINFDDLSTADDISVTQRKKSKNLFATRNTGGERKCYWVFAQIYYLLVELKRLSSG